MAISQAELKTALQTLLSTVKFRLRGRRGTAAQLDPTLMKAGEFAFCTDTRTLYACFVDGTIEQVSHGFIPKATYATLAALQAAHPTGAASDYYMVGTGPYHLYNWDGVAWADMGVWNDMSIYATSSSVAALAARVTALESQSTETVNCVLPATSGSVIFRKSGKLVTATLSAAKTGGFLTAAELIATIPVGYRPQDTIVADILFRTSTSDGTTYVAGRGIAFSNGDFTVMSSAGSKTSVVGQLVWLIA